MSFARWLETFLGEKGIDGEEIIEVEGPSGANFIPTAILVSIMKSAPANERAGIKEMLVKLDFVNAPIRPYLAHLAKAIAQ